MFSPRVKSVNCFNNLGTCSWMIVSSTNKTKKALLLWCVHPSTAMSRLWSCCLICRRAILQLWTTTTPLPCKSPWITDTATLACCSTLKWNFQSDLFDVFLNVNDYLNSGASSSSNDALYTSYFSSFFNNMTTLIFLSTYCVSATIPTTLMPSFSLLTSMTITNPF